MAVVNQRQLEQLAESTYCKLGAKRDPRFRFRKTPMSMSEKRGIITNAKAVGASPIDFVEAQFAGLPPDFCRRVWGRPYPLAYVMCTEGARWRYRRWKGNKDSFARAGGETVNVIEDSMREMRNLLAAQEPNESVRGALLLTWFSSGMLAPELAALLIMRDDPVVRPIAGVLRDLPCVAVVLEEMTTNGN